MRKFLLVLLTITGLLFSEETEEKKKKNSYFVDNFLKYSTFYFSVGLDSPFAPAQKFKVDTQAGTFEETTQEIEASYNLTIGVRKFVSQPVKNRIGKSWMEHQKLLKSPSKKMKVRDPVSIVGKKWVKKQLLLKKAGVK